MTTRKCGACRQPGHTRATCPGVGVDPITICSAGDECGRCDRCSPLLDDRTAAGDEGDAPLSVEPPTVDTVTTTTQTAADEFVSPGGSEPAENVSGQPEPKRDSWGRYLLAGPNGSKPKPFTRATTFAKSISDTYALSQWGKRNVAIGMALRPDLVAQAHGKHVRHDKRDLDRIHEQAAEAAGNKVSANLGTALHSFTERLDAGLMQPGDVPPQFRAMTDAYTEKIRAAGLTSQPDWIERSTLSASLGEPVAGTMDRIFRLPSGEHVIGDLKTGRDLTYGWQEIAIQLLIYATGVNEYGLYDWSTDTWQSGPKVREDYAIVMHLPVERDDNGPAFCQLYQVELEPAREAARMCAGVRAWRKNRSLARVWAPPMAPVPWETQFGQASSRGELSGLYVAASKEVDLLELDRLVRIGQRRLRQVEEPAG